MQEVAPLHVIVNPASGTDEPVLAILNRAFRAQGARWSVSVTQGEGDAEQAARRAVAAGAQVVAAYGGDGSVSAVAAGLRGSGVPLAILPGGTGNVVAQELGVPLDLEAAALLAASVQPKLRPLDGMQVGEQLLLLRAGVGADARVMDHASRERKDALGWFAYVLGALEEVRDPQLFHLRVSLDGKPAEELEAFGLLVVNVGRLGRANARIPGEADPSDGWLDVFVLRDANLRTLFDLGVRLLPWSDHRELGPLVHARAKHVRVEVSGNAAEQPVHGDGDPLGLTPLEATLVPAAVRVIVPR